MSSEATAFTIADDGTFHAPLVLSYPYKRTMGPTMSRFLIGLRDQRIEGTVGSDGTIYVPPAEFDPITGQALSEWRTVADEGTVLSWSWQPTVDDASPLSQPFAWALIKLDGADTPLLHAVEVVDPPVTAKRREQGLRQFGDRIVHWPRSMAAQPPKSNPGSSV